MSGNVFPVPQDTPFEDGSPSKFNFIWTKFFKAVSDELMLANIIKYIGSDVDKTGIDYSLPKYAAIKPIINKNFKYVINGNIVFCTYYIETPLTTIVTIPLPYTATLPFDISGVIYPENTKEVTIPVNTGYVRFWYVVNSSQIKTRET